MRRRGGGRFPFPKLSRDREHFWTKEKILATMGKTQFVPVHLYTFLERDNIYVNMFKDSR